MTDIIAMHRADLVDAVTAAVTPIKAERDALAASRDERSAQLIEAERRIVALAAELAKEKGGWDAFYKLRRSIGEDRYPGMVGEVTASEAPVRHAVTCKLFPDPFDERDPVGPCTCGATSETAVKRSED